MRRERRRRLESVGDGTLPAGTRLFSRTLGFDGLRPAEARAAHRGSSRACLVVPHPSHAGILVARARALLGRPRRAHRSGPHT